MSNLINSEIVAAEYGKNDKGEVALFIESCLGDQTGSILDEDDVHTSVSILPTGIIIGLIGVTDNGDEAPDEELVAHQFMDWATIVRAVVEKKFDDIAVSLVTIPSTVEGAE